MATIVVIGLVNIPLSLFPPYCAKIIINKVYVTRKHKCLLDLRIGRYGSIHPFYFLREPCDVSYPQAKPPDKF